MGPLTDDATLTTKKPRPTDKYAAIGDGEIVADDDEIVAGDDRQLQSVTRKLQTEAETATNGNPLCYEAVGDEDKVVGARGRPDDQRC